MMNDCEGSWIPGEWIRINLNGIRDRFL